MYEPIMKTSPWREVEELQDPVDHRVADGDEPVQAPAGQARDELVEEVAPGELEVLEVREPRRQPPTDIGQALSEGTCGPSSDGPHADSRKDWGN
jgi:hypothetical protein